MAWDDAPPSKMELAKAEPMSWDQSPPTPGELKTASLVSRINDAPQGPSAPGVANSALSHIASGGSFGFDDEIGGALGAAGRALGIDHLGGQIKNIGFNPDGPTLDPDKLKQAYYQDRDSLRQLKSAASETHPIVSGASDLAGGLMNPIFGVGGKVAKSLSGGGAAMMGGGTAAKIGAGLATSAGMGGIYGGIQGVGDSNADTIGGMAGDAEHSAKWGAGIGGALHAAMPAVAAGYNAAKPALGEALQNFAETKAFKATGAMLRDFRAADKRGLVNETGRYALDNGLVTPLATYEDVAQRAAALKDKAGAQLDGVYNQASDGFNTAENKVGFDPVAHKPAIMAAAKQALGNTVGGGAALSKLENYIDEVAANNAGAPSEAAQKYQRELAEFNQRHADFLENQKAYQESLGRAGENPGQPALPGLVDDLQRPSMRSENIELNGKDANVMAPRPSVQATQPELPMLPTGNSEAARIFGRPGDASFGHAGGDAADRVGKNVVNSLEGPAQLDFLNQNSKNLIANGAQGEINGTGLTNRTFANVERPVMQGQAGQTKMIIAPEAPAAPVEPPDFRTTMNPRQSNSVKTAIDNEINYARNPLSKEPATETAFSAARKVVAGKVADSVQAHGSDELVDQLRGANKDFGMSTRIGDIATDRVSREAANRAFGLTDTIAGGAGATAGAAIAGPPGALLGGAAMGGINKLGRTYGNSLMATGADKVSQFLLKSPAMQKMATENPRAFQAMVIDLAPKMNPARSAMPAAAAAASNSEMDKNSSSSSQYKSSTMPEPPAQSQQKFLEGN
jgi:hypothetical protein